MKKFEITAIGLEEMSLQEVSSIEGGFWTAIGIAITIITLIDWATDAYAGWNSYEEETIQRH